MAINLPQLFDETERNETVSRVKREKEKISAREKSGTILHIVQFHLPTQACANPTRGVNRAPDFTIPYTNEFILLLRTSCFRLAAIMHQPLYYALLSSFDLRLPRKFPIRLYANYIQLHTPK